MMKIEQAFFPLTASAAQKLINLGLSGKEWELWCYFAPLAPFPNSKVQLPSWEDIQDKLSMKRSTYKAAIAKFIKLKVFNFYEIINYFDESSIGEDSPKPSSKSRSKSKSEDTAVQNSSPEIQNSSPEIQNSRSSVLETLEARASQTPLDQQIKRSVKKTEQETESLAAIEKILAEEKREREACQQDKTPEAKPSIKPEIAPEAKPVSRPIPRPKLKNAKFSSKPTNKRIPDSSVVETEKILAGEMEVQQESQNPEAREILTSVREVMSLNPQIRALALGFTLLEVQQAVELYKASAKKKPITKPHGWLTRALQGRWWENSQPNQVPSQSQSKPQTPSYATDLINWYDAAMQAGVVDRTPLADLPRDSCNEPQVHCLKPIYGSHVNGMWSLLPIRKAMLEFPLPTNSSQTVEASQESEERDNR